MRNYSDRYVNLFGPQLCVDVATSSDSADL